MGVFGWRRHGANRLQQYWDLVLQELKNGEVFYLISLLSRPFKSFCNMRTDACMSIGYQIIAPALTGYYWAMSRIVAAENKSIAYACLP
jgi:hypothetical protein